MTNTHILERLDVLIKQAQAHGADAADAVYYESAAESVTFRNGKFENAERSESKDMGLRVMIGQQQASASTTDLSTENLDVLAERVVNMARLAPEDPHIGLAAADQLAKTWPDTDSFDPDMPSSDVLRQRALAVEAAALDVKGITNSEGGSASHNQMQFGLQTTNGFSAIRRGTNQSISAVVLAGAGTGMERGYDYATAVYGSDLPDEAHIGAKAAEQTLRQLNPKKAESQTAPVVFEPRQARSLLSHLSSAINGSSIARGTSFLKDKMGQKLFRDGITVTDDPHRRRGLASLAFDAEGLPNKAINLIEDGRLTRWVLDLRTAHQLGLKSNARARRGVGAPSPGVTNLHLHAGTESPEALIGDIKSGLLVTSMFGPQVNRNTGDYSCGVAGQWIENGEVVYPVSEITIAGNLLAMFAQLTPAHDLAFRDSVNSPTVRIDAMTIAGM